MHHTLSKYMLAIAPQTDSLHALQQPHLGDENGMPPVQPYGQEQVTGIS
jgi:hypothetical protein